MSYYALNKVTFVPIAETTLSSATASITFSDLGAYEHLIIYANLRYENASLTSDIGLRFNGDTGNNYNYKWYLGYGGGSDTVTYGHSSLQNRMEIGGSVGTSHNANVFSNHKILIPNYRRTTFYHNMMVWQYGAGHKSATSNDIRTGFYAGNWANTNAITSLTIFSSLGYNLSIGSKVAIWGL